VVTSQKEWRETPNANLDDLDAALATSTLTWWELILAGIVFVVAILLARLVRRNIRSWLEARPGVAPHVPELIGRLSGWEVTLVGIVAALMVLGFQMGPVVLILLIFAVTAAVSARRIMENWAAGLSLQIVAPFTVGDRIESEGITGWVEQINSRAVVLSSRDRRTVHIPNSMVVDSVLYNYTDDQAAEVQRLVGLGATEAHWDRGPADTPNATEPQRPATPPHHQSGTYGQHECSAQIAHIAGYGRLSPSAYLRLIRGSRSRSIVADPPTEYDRG
jgi:small-conductance mechanosensitive channel